MPASRQAQLSELQRVKKVGVTAANKLLAEGYTLFRLSHAEPERIAEILKVSVKAAKEIVADALVKVVSKRGDLDKPMNVKEYKQFLEKRINWYTSGSKEIDRLIGGGFRSSSIVGLSGPQETGKSQAVLTAMVDCICNKGKHAYFIETELDTLDPDRLEEIAMARGWIDKWDPEKFHVISSYQVRDVATQFYYYEVVYDMAKENGWDGGVLGVDSFNSSFQRKFKGRELFPTRKQEFGRHFSALEDFAKDLNWLVMLTFQVMEVPVMPSESKGGMDTVRARAYFGTGYIPWGGHGARHPPATWLSLEKTHSKDLWKAYLFGSSRQPLGECFFQITERGIDDVPEARLKRMQGAK